MDKIKIGVLIANKENKVIGYSFEKGFFICKDSFFDNSFYKNNLENSETIWFSNITEDNLKNKDIKSKDFFGVSIDEIISFHGLDNVKNGKNLNFKVILKKLFDIFEIFIGSYLNAFKKDELEKVNQKAKTIRIKNRYNNLLDKRSYTSILLSIKKDYQEDLVIKNIKTKEGKHPVNPFKFYNETYYIDKNKGSISPILNSKEIQKSERTVINEKSKEILISTLDVEAMKKIDDKRFYSINDYRISNLGDIYHLKNNDLSKIEEVLFYLVKINKTPKQRIFKALLNTTQWVSKKELDFYISSGFLVSIEYVCEKIPESKDYLFEFSLKSIDLAIEDGFNNSIYHQNIHNLNYLQIIRFNDNNILNKWIYSCLKTNTMSLINRIENSFFEVVEYDYDYIKISYNQKDEKILIELMEKLNLSYPASIIKGI